MKPTAAHALLRVLKERGWLQRVYTQNVDGLEHPLLAQADVVECHGSARRALCSRCPLRVPEGPDTDRLFWGPLRAGALPLCPACAAPLRPAVALFGEPLPARYGEISGADAAACDMLLVMGTSLLVYPVAALPQAVAPAAVRVCVGLEPAGCFVGLDPCPESPGLARPAVPAAEEESAQRRPRWMCRGYRDVVYRGECDAGAVALAAALGWQADLAGVVEQFCSSVTHV